MAAFKPNTTKHDTLYSKYDLLQKSDLTQLTIKNLQISDESHSSHSNHKHGSSAKAISSRMELYRRMIYLLEAIPERDRKLISNYHSQYILPLSYGVDTNRTGFHYINSHDKFAEKLSDCSSPLINGLKISTNPSLSNEHPTTSVFSPCTVIEKSNLQTDSTSDLKNVHSNKNSNNKKLTFNNQIKLNLLDSNIQKSKVPITNSKQILRKKLHEMNNSELNGEESAVNSLTKYYYESQTFQINMIDSNGLDKVSEESVTNVLKVPKSDIRASNKGICPTEEQMDRKLEGKETEVGREKEGGDDDEEELEEEPEKLQEEEEEWTIESLQSDHRPLDTRLEGTLGNRVEAHAPALDLVTLHRAPAATSTTTATNANSYTFHSTSSSSSDVKVMSSKMQSATADDTAAVSAKPFFPNAQNCSSSLSEPSKSLIMENGEYCNSKESTPPHLNHYSHVSSKKLLIVNDKPPAVFWKKLIRYSAYQYFDLDGDNCSNRLSSTPTSDNGISNSEDSLSDQNGDQRVPNGTLNNPELSDHSDLSVEMDLNRNNKTFSKLKIIDLANNYSTEKSKCPQEEMINGIGFNANGPSINGSNQKKCNQINKCWCGDTDVGSIQSLNSSCNSAISSPHSFSSLDSDLDIRNHQRIPNSSDSDLSSDTSRILNRNYYGSVDGSVDTPILSDSSEVVHSDVSVISDDSCKKIQTIFKRSDFSDSENSEVEMNLETAIKNGDPHSPLNKSNKRFKMDQYKRIKNPLLKINSKINKTPISYKNNLRMIVTSISKTQLDITTTSIKRRKSSPTREFNQIQDDGIKQNPNKRRKKYHQYPVYKNDDNCASNSLETKNLENSVEGMSVKEIIQTDEELARRLQQEEYLAARPARRRVALVAYDRLHEQLSRLKKEPLVEDPINQNKPKPISGKRRSTSKDSESESKNSKDIKNQETSRDGLQNSNNEHKSNPLPDRKNYKDIARFFGTSMNSPQRICSRMLEYAVQNDLVFKKKSSYYLNCDKTISNLFGVQGSIRFFTLTRLIYKLAAKC